VSRASTDGAAGHVAIIGMALRVPGARTVEDFWENLRAGRESIRFFSVDELRAAGIAADTLAAPTYVRANGVLDDAELFDAALFGTAPREAAIMDPQQRIFLQCAWEALEHAGYDPATYRGRIGAFAGMGLNTYLLFNLRSNPAAIAEVGEFQAVVANDKDFLATRAGYRLNLRGPCITVQTACSTSLVATHLACQSLLAGECDIAIAGGATITVPQITGYLHQPGGIWSPDGHCRAFDAAAGGFVRGNGVAVVVLARLTDALADRATVHAVIRGSAVNNDGGVRAGFTTPTVAGQVDLVSEALAFAECDADSISYVEAHGTGTPLGDTVEIAALTKAFAAGTRRRQFCAVGSVKTNIGHLDTAAGVTGLIKTVLALRHRMLPPSLHFERPNPRIDFADSPFYVNVRLEPWRAGSTPRRAAVTSLGLGGTNAHVVLEEAPPPTTRRSAEPAAHLLVLSAKTATALAETASRLARHLRAQPTTDLDDVATTLQRGRRALPHRGALVCRDVETAITALDAAHVAPGSSATVRGPAPGIVFMFPGGGAQHPGMHANLYSREPAFRREVDRCLALLPDGEQDTIRAALYPEPAMVQDARARLRRTAVALPALFITEYALARLLMSWGAKPAAMIGHSLGEYVAATLAGVFSVELALALVRTRGALFERLPAGAMLSIPLGGDAVAPELPDDVAIAAFNAPDACVASGPVDAVDALARRLTAQRIDVQRLHIDVAAHSAIVDGILAEFHAFVAALPLAAPTIPFVSNVTGTWITGEAATDPAYWTRHLREPVRFSDGIATLAADPDSVFVDVGPGTALGVLARQHPACGAARRVIALSPHPSDPRPDVEVLQAALGQLWLAGVEIAWDACGADRGARRIPLPTYPFEGRRHWVEALAPAAGADAGAVPLRRTDLRDWCYAPSWTWTPQPPLAAPSTATTDAWLVFLDAAGFGRRLAEHIAKAGAPVVTVAAGDGFVELSDTAVAIHPTRADDYDALLAMLESTGRRPARVVHLSTLGDTPTNDAQAADPLFGLLLFAQAVGRRGWTTPLSIVVVTDRAHDVHGGEPVVPAKALTLGAVRVIPREYPSLACRMVDVTPAEPGSVAERMLIDDVLREAAQPAVSPVVAYRRGRRWAQTFVALAAEAADPHAVFRERGVYLITGGFGGIGRSLAEYLARTVRARLVLVGRSVDDGAAAFVAGLESAGADVLALRGDVTDRDAMREIVGLARARFGAIHGVVHAAGVAAGGMIQLKTREALETVLAPKVAGTRVLLDVLADLSLDFVVLCSALDSLLGTFGLSDHCAANAFLDAVAQATGSGTRVVAINWAAWQEVGQAATTAMPGALAAIREATLQRGVRPAEGVEIFTRALAMQVPQVIVSPYPFDWTMAQSSALAATMAEHTDAQPASTTQPRPPLGVAYVAPASDAERSIAAIWRSLLGLDDVGVDDNFFELGGHSLLAVQLVTRLRATFRIDVSLHEVLDARTIAWQAVLVEDAVLRGIEALADDEAARLADSGAAG
jgi:acyl transferase domain-containing protein/acyl carrier protein